MRIAIGTRKGLWTANGDRGHWTVSQPLKDMAEFASVAWVPRGDGEGPRLLVGARSWFWGPSVLASDDDGVTWSERESGAISFPAETGAALERVWTLTPDPRIAGRVWAGAEPHSLWRSDDGGNTFTLNKALWDHPHRADWAPGAGGPAVHTIVPRPDAGMTIAMSTGGVYRSADSESGWRPANAGITVVFGPDPYPEYGQCVHRIAMDAQDPNLLYAQNHGGVFRSDDGGSSWQSISAGLPSDFGFIVLAHPTRGRVAWVIPIDSATMFPPGGRLRLWRTDDAGATWQEVGAGLPDGHYASVLRDAAHVIDLGGTAAIAFGTRNGSVYASLDEGETFDEVATRLPDVLSVRASA
ncbi:MAG: hypothetical protein KGN78_12335 [Actinomycetales bacterium]|nr:hypothetical protein [Actinomycetales bacterium]